MPLRARLRMPLRARLRMPLRARLRTRRNSRIRGRATGRLLLPTSRDTYAGRPHLRDACATCARSRRRARALRRSPSLLAASVESSLAYLRCSSGRVCSSCRVYWLYLLSRDREHDRPSQRLALCRAPAWSTQGVRRGQGARTTRPPYGPHRSFRDRPEVGSSRTGSTCWPPGTHGRVVVIEVRVAFRGRRLLT